jgi:hypothetical protein
MKNWIRKWLGIPGQTVPVVKLEMPESAVVVFRFRKTCDMHQMLHTWEMLQDGLAPAEVVMVPEDAEFHTAIQK